MSTSPCRVLAAALPLLTLAAGSVLTAQPMRPGVTTSFVQIGGATGGVDGRAYLPAVPSGVTMGTGPCGRQVTMNARSRTGAVREMRVVVETSGPGNIDLASSSCPRATIEATFEDGSVVTGATGSVDVQSLDEAGEPVLTARFAWSPQRNGQPMPFRGMLVVPRPAAP